MSTSSITLGFIALASKSQLSVAVSMAFEVKPQLENKGFKLSAYARTVALDSIDSISEKTATNYATVAKKICNKLGVKMDLYAFTSEDVLLFTNFVTSEVAASGYTASLDDIAAYCDGAPSQKTRRLAALAAAAEAAEAKAAAEAKTEAEKKLASEVQAERVKQDLTQAQAAADKAEAERKEAEAKAEAERLAKADAEHKAGLLQSETDEAKQAQAKAEAEAQAAKAEAEAQAEAQRKFQASVCIQVRVKEDGSADITLADNMHPEFLADVIHALQAEHKRMKKGALKAA